MDNKKRIELIRDMSNANGVSRFERGVVEVIKKYYDEDVFNVEVDRMNNIKVERKDQDNSKRKIYLDCHIDELGLMCQAITKRGELKVANLGGWDPKNLYAEKFRMLSKNGEWIKGIVSTIPVHFMTPEMRNFIPAYKDLKIDIGANSYEEAIEMGAYVGMPMVPDVEFEYFDKLGGILMGKAFDNRIGTAMLIDTMNSDYNRDKYEIVGLMSSQEEVGARGAEILANKYQEADFVIVYEGVPADDGHVDMHEAQAISGGGVQIRLKDAGMISDPAFVNLAVEICEKNNIPYQLLVREGGSTNGKMYHAHGIPSIVISTPVRFAHTHYNISKLSDYNHALDLALKLIDHVNKYGLPEIKIQ